MSTLRVRRLSVLAAAAAAVFATAFSCEASTASISADDLAKSITQQFKDKTGQTAEVTCKDGLNASTGETSTCIATSDGVTADLKVTFTEKKDDKIYFDWAVVESTRKLSAARAKEVLSEVFQKQNGFTLTKLDCPPSGFIPGQVGAVAECAVEADDGDKGTMKITVTAAEGMHVEFNGEWQA
ncbi:MAG: DUF4333 domain-containing protein [Nocardiaceae bacterium]|nr:DUF4333 domain-containing protein [Nocardiaceae bacterium]